MNPLEGRTKLTAYADAEMTVVTDSSGVILGKVVELGTKNPHTGRVPARVRGLDGSMWRAQLRPEKYCTLIREGIK